MISENKKAVQSTILSKTILSPLANIESLPQSNPSSKVQIVIYFKKTHLIAKSNWKEGSTVKEWTIDSKSRGELTQALVRGYPKAKQDSRL